jgi:ABC-type phosphate transport system substrate-binding protein
MSRFIKMLLLLSFMPMAQAEPSEATIAIVVASNQNTDVLKLSPNDLSLIYWRKQLYWPKGQRIKPVNLSTDHHLRQLFSEKILGSAPKSQIDYWNGQYFNGVLPPYVVNSEEAVLRYVTQTNGAIGYVNACAVDNRVKTLFWLMPNSNILSSNPPALNCAN